MERAEGSVTDVFELILEHDDLADLDVAERRLAMRALLVDNGASPDLVARVAAVVDGYGAIDELMRDPNVTDVLVNAFDDVWVERGGTLVRTPVAFSSETDLTETIERLIARGGGRVDAARPIADVALPDGSRMHVVLPPVSAGGPKMSVRRFPKQPLTLRDLHEVGTFDLSSYDLLTESVRARRTIAISGGTGVGKTTLLNALLSEVPETERLITIEETPELRPRCQHHVALIARAPNVEGRGEVTLAELMRAALRMRPDRIVVGEVRGPEALVALDAFSTGHAGSMVTAHARSAGDVCERLVSLASGGTKVEPQLLRSRFDDAFDVIVHLEKTRGQRRVAAIVKR